jgi:hypothetical protein
MTFERINALQWHMVKICENVSCELNKGCAGMHNGCQGVASSLAGLFF